MHTRQEAVTLLSAHYVQLFTHWCVLFILQNVVNSVVRFHSSHFTPEPKHFSRKLFVVNRPKQEWKNRYFALAPPYKLIFGMKRDIHPDIQDVAEECIWIRINLSESGSMRTQVNNSFHYQPISRINFQSIGYMRQHTAWNKGKCPLTIYTQVNCYWIPSKYLHTMLYGRIVYDLVLVLV